MNINIPSSVPAIGEWPWRSVKVIGKKGAAPDLACIPWPSMPELRPKLHTVWVYYRTLIWRPH